MRKKITARRAFQVADFILFGICAAIIAGVICTVHRVPAPAVSEQMLAFKHSLFHETLQEQTVQVVTDKGSGTGVVIKRDDKVFVWTAAHVVAGRSDVEVRQQFRFGGVKAGLQVFTAHVIARLPDTDAALLWVDAPPDKLTGAEWADIGAGVGTSVVHVGNIFGKNFEGSVSEGIVSQIGVSPKDFPEWPWPICDQSTVIMFPGCSGGPLFTLDGKITGLVVGGPPEARPGVSCYVPLRAIYEAARKAGVVWALYGQRAPHAKTLEEMIVASTIPEAMSIENFLKIIIGETPPPQPDCPPPAKPKAAPVKPIKSPKGQ